MLCCKERKRLSVKKNNKTSSSTNEPMQNSFPLCPLHLYKPHPYVDSLLAFLSLPSSCPAWPFLPHSSGCLHVFKATPCLLLHPAPLSLVRLRNRPCEIKSPPSDKKCLGGKGSQSIRSGLSPNKCYLRVAGLSRQWCYLVMMPLLKIQPRIVF